MAETIGHGSPNDMKVLKSRGGVYEHIVLQFYHKAFEVLIIYRLSKRYQIDLLSFKMASARSSSSGFKRNYAFVFNLNIVNTVFFDRWIEIC